jgi:hypothetical protein
MSLVSKRKLQEVPIPTVTVPKPWELTLACGWRGGTRLMLHPTTRGRPVSDAPVLRGAFAREKPAIDAVHEIGVQGEWNVCTRKLANQSHGVFVDLQEMESGVGQKQSVIKLSRSYRAIIHACILDLQESANSAEDDVIVSQYNTQCELFEMTELIWHLAEILFIECAPG